MKTIGKMIDEAVFNGRDRTRAELIARTEIVQTVRQRLTPRAADPSVQPRGVARRASVMIATMIGTIITVRITSATIRLDPVS